MIRHIRRASLPVVAESAWTDERLDDRFDQLDSRLDRLERKSDQGFAELRAELHVLQATLVRVGGGMMAGLVGVIAAVLVRGG